MPQKTQAIRNDRKWMETNRVKTESCLGMCSGTFTRTEKTDRQIDRQDLTIWILSFHMGSLLPYTTLVSDDCSSQHGMCESVFSALATCNQLVFVQHMRVTEYLSVVLHAPCTTDKFVCLCNKGRVDALRIATASVCVCVLMQDTQAHCTSLEPITGVALS